MQQAASAGGVKGAATAWDCNSCPNAVAEVCAELPGSGGARLTVAHACLAECQGLTNVRPGTCDAPVNYPGAHAKGGAGCS